MSSWQSPLTPEEEKSMHPDALALLRHYQMERLPVEGTLFKSTYRAAQKTAVGGPVGTAMVGMYSNQPLSVSCFHRLDHDEVWHFYGGDPFNLVLLHPDGAGERLRMGANILKGERVQFVVPAQSWQAGYLISGGRYALFGCTMAPGFTGGCFEAGLPDTLIKQYLDYAEEIRRLAVNEGETRMPKGFAT